MLRLAKSLFHSLCIFVVFSLFNMATAAIPATPTSSPTATNYSPPINQLYRVKYPSDSNTIAYQVQQKVGASGSWILVKHSQDLFYGISHSTAGQYYYRYRRLNLDGESGYSPELMVTVGTVPVTPTSAPSSSVGSTAERNVTYQISWPGNSQSVVYDLSEKTTSAWGLSYWGPNTSKNYTKSSVNNYYYKQRQCNDLGCSGYSPSRLVYVYGVPGNITDLSASPSSAEIGVTSRLTWSRPGGVAGPIAYYRLIETRPNNSQQTTSNITPGDRTFWDVTPGNGAGSYTYQLQVCNAKDTLCSAWSSVSVNVTSPSPPNNQVVQGSIWINGNAVKGSTLTVGNNLSDGNGLGSFNYQWKRNASNISGATGTSYTLVQADVGSKISINISFTDGDGYAESVASPQTATVTTVNTTPTLSSVLPAANTTFLSTQNVVVTATATDSDGSIASIQFKLDSGSWNAITTSPYSYNFGVITAGAHTLQVRAVDDEGAYSTTVSRNIIVAAATTNERKVVFIHTDLLGSPAAESDEQGNVQ